MLLKHFSKREKQTTFVAIDALRVKIKLRPTSLLLVQFIFILLNINNNFSPIKPILKIWARNVPGTTFPSISKYRFLGIVIKFGHRMFY